MNTKNLLLLLEIVKGNGTVDSLLKRGVEYSQIASLISKAKSEDYICFGEDGRSLKLTPKGESSIRDLSLNFSGGKTMVWIAPYDQARTERIEVSDIFIPENPVKNLD